MLVFLQEANTRTCVLCRCEVLKQAIGKVNVDLAEANAEAKRLGAEIVEVRQFNISACLPSYMHARSGVSLSPSGCLKAAT